MTEEKTQLLDEFHILLNKLEISEQISFLENNNEKIKNRIQNSEKPQDCPKSWKLKRKHDIGIFNIFQIPRHTFRKSKAKFYSRVGEKCLSMAPEAWS